MVKVWSETNKHCCSSSPTSILGQHKGCMVETCCVLGFNQLFVLHTTSPKISPSARWPCRLNPQPRHLTAYLLVTATILIISRCTPISTSSCHVRQTVRLSVSCFPFSPVKEPDYCLREKKKIHERWWGFCATRLVWTGLTCKIRLKLRGNV